MSQEAACGWVRNACVCGDQSSACVLVREAQSGDLAHCPQPSGSLGLPPSAAASIFTGTSLPGWVSPPQSALWKADTCVRDSNPGYTTAFGLDFPAACRINRYCFSHRVTLSTHPSLLQEGVRNLRSRFCRGLVTLRATCSPVGFGVFNKCGLCIGKAGDGSSFKNSSGSCCEMEWQRWFRARLRLALRSLFCSQPVNLGRRAELLPDGLWLWLLLGKS